MERSLLTTRAWRIVLIGSLMGAMGCSPANKQIKVGGGDAAIIGFIIPVKETFEEENGIALKIFESKPGRELIDLEKGRVDAIVSAGSVHDLIKEAADSKVSIDPASLREVKVGRSRTVVFLHKGNSVKKLTKKQVRGIFTGKLTNWKQVGGPNKEIVVVWNPSTAVENEVFLKEILNGEPLRLKYFPVNSFEEVRKFVMETPGAVGIGPHGMIASAIRVPKIPTVASPVVVVTKGDPSPNVQKLIELLKDVELIP